MSGPSCTLLVVNIDTAVCQCIFAQHWQNDHELHSNLFYSANDPFLICHFAKNTGISIKVKITLQLKHMPWTKYTYASSFQKHLHPKVNYPYPKSEMKIIQMIKKKKCSLFSVIHWFGYYIFWISRRYTFFENYFFNAFDVSYFVIQLFLGENNNIWKRETTEKNYTIIGYTGNQITVFYMAGFK